MRNAKELSAFMQVTSGLQIFFLIVATLLLIAVIVSQFNTKK